MGQTYPGLAKERMDEFVNPDSYIDAQRSKKKEEEQKAKYPPEPLRDVMLFLMQEAPLTRWQRNVMGIIRDEAYYFAPQAMTKIMNEGWASYWHTHMLTKCGILDQVIDYADRHSRATATSRGQIAYKLGIELFRNIEERWNLGRFGRVRRVLIWPSGPTGIVKQA